jgi:hypothetical protein
METMRIRYRRVFNRSIAAFSAVAVLGFCSQADPAQATVPAGEVPTFQLRARIVSSGGKNDPQAVHTYSFSAAAVTSTGDQWSVWLPFARPDAERAVGPNSYPNNYMRGFPVVVRLAVNPVTDPTDIEAELKLDGNETTQKIKARLYGGSLGLLLWREADKSPRAATMAEYNQRYWQVLSSVTIRPEERPRLFPIVDRFISGDSDRLNVGDGIANLARAGFSAIMLPPEKIQRDVLMGTGLRRTAWAVYSPPGYAFDHNASVTEAAITNWATKEATPYLAAGYAPQDMAIFAMSDEPGWYYPSAFAALTNNPAALTRFRTYLKDQGLSPKDVGASNWETVQPVGRSRAVDLPSKRLFYWTMRFYAWDSARHFARCTRALESAFYTNMPILVNWNFFSGRFYVPGPVANNPAKRDPDAAMGGHDWLEFGRMRGCTMLWTEDWFVDELAYQWSYYCARLRCAAALGGVEFGGYVIPRTAGSRTNGIVQKILTVVGSGGKAIKYFVFGPEYSFPGNCYSENVRVLPAMAEAHRMIGAAEDVLWPGRRPRPDVAILMPRSAQVWDAKDQKIASGIDDATRVHLNCLTVDYMAEVYDLYLALQHANIPTDVVDEDDLVPEKLKAYRVLYVTEPNIPEEGQKGLVEWTKKGGFLVTVSGAGIRDRYDEPCGVLADGTSLTEEPRERLLISDANRLPVVTNGKGTNGEFKVVGARGKLALDKKASIEATFDDGAPAIALQSIGRGRRMHFAFLPGVSYLRSCTRTKDGLPVGFSDPLRSYITAPVTMAGVKPPVTTDKIMVETPLLLSDKGAAVTLLNWSGEAIEQLNVRVETPFTVKAVRSAKRGEMKFETKEKRVSFSLPLDAADIVTLKP